MFFVELWSAKEGHEEWAMPNNLLKSKEYISYRPARYYHIETLRFKAVTSTPQVGNRIGRHVR